MSIDSVFTTWSKTQTYGMVCVLTIFVLILLIALPNSGWADEALDQFNEAHAHVEKGSYKQAVDALNAAIQAYPHFAEAHHLLGLVYFTGLKQPEQAVIAFKQALAHYPNFARALLDLGVVLQYQKKTADAEASYQRALEVYPRFIEAHLALASLYDQMKRPQKAIRAYTSLLKIEPLRPDALYRLAYWHHRAGETQEAQGVLDRLHKTNVKHLDGWLLKGEILEKVNRPESAIEAYNKALNIKGDLIHPHDALGYLYQEQGNSAKAAKHFKEVIRLDPKNPEAHLNLGVVLASLKRLDEAEREYQTAISLDPNLTDAYHNLGVFYEFHRKDTEKALVQYREYLKRGGTDERITNLVKKVEK